MTQVLLFALFFVLFASRMLGLDLSLAPGLSVKNAFLYAIFLALAIETAVTRRRTLELLPVFVPFALYVAYASFSWLVVMLIIDYPGYSPRTSLMDLKAGPIEHFLVLLVFYYGVMQPQRALWLMRSMVWLIIAGNVITVFDSPQVLDLGLFGVNVEGRAVGPLGNANEFAALLVTFLPAGVALYLTQRGMMKGLAAVGVALSGIAFMMAVSRGAFVGLALGAGVGAYYLRAYIPTQTLMRAAFGALALGVIAVAGAFLVGYGELLLDRFGLLGRGGFDASSGRTMIWGRALDEMLNHPLSLLTGFGWHAYETSSPSGFAPHNTYLNIMYNLGIIGLALFVLTAVNVLAVARRALAGAPADFRPWIIASILGFMSLLGSILFGELQNSWLYVWAFVGIALRLAVESAGAAQAATVNEPSVQGFSAIGHASTDTGDVGARTGLRHGRMHRAAVVTQEKPGRMGR